MRTSFTFKHNMFLKPNKVRFVQFFHQSLMKTWRTRKKVAPSWGNDSESSHTSLQILGIPQMSV